MEAFVTSAARISRSEREFIAANLTNPGSQFQSALTAGSQAGVICLCFDRGEIIGWARAEPWFDGEETRLELGSFTAPAYRRRGVATFCVMGLVASGAFSDATHRPAIFSRSMVGIAKRSGLSPILYVKEGDSWTKKTD